MVDAAPASKATSLRRDSVLEAVAFAAERLLLSEDWRAVAPEVLGRLGSAVVASRATVIENTVDRDGAVRHAIAFEWCAAGVPGMIGDRELAGAPWSARFPHWAAILSSGAEIQGAVSDQPRPERDELTRQGVASVAYIPIEVDGDWWGVVGFDDTAPRDWGPDDLEGLRTAAVLLGGAIRRQRQEAQVRRAEARYRSVVEQIPAITYVDIVEDDGVRMGFLSPQIESLLGFPYEDFLTDGERWFELIHPDDRARVDTAARRAGAETVPFDEEYRMRTADNSWVWVHDTTLPVHDEHGQITHFQGFLIDVTARKEAEHRALETEARYREFLEGIPAVTYTDILQGDEVVMGYVSPQIEQVLGRPAQAFLDDERLWGRLIHPEDYARMAKEDAFDPEDTTPFEQEYRMQRADGEWVWVHDTSTAVFGPDGAIEYFQGFMVDITARTQAEEAAQRADERFRVLVEQMPAIVYTERVAPGTASAVEMDYISPRAESLLGHPRASWLSDVDFWSKIVHPEDRAAVDAEVARVNTTGDPLSIDYRVVAADGRVVWLHEEAVLIRTAEGEPDYWQGFMLDITERRQAEEQIRLAEERFRMIVEHTPAITYQEGVGEGAAYDLSGAFVYMSPQVERILGYPVEAWAYTRDFWMQVVHPDDLEAVVEVSARTAQSGEPYRQEYRMIAADGRVVWLHDESHLIHDSDGRPVLWQGVMVDITERKEAEAQLLHARERLQALIDHVPAVVYIEAPDADPSRFYISPQVEALLGHTPHDWTWTPDFWIDHVHPDDRALAEEVDARVDRSREPYAMEYRFRRADGSYVWVHDEAVFLDTPEGGFWQGFLFDISSQKESEQRIAAAERVFRATVEHLPAVVYREPPHREQLERDFYISPQVEAILGFTRDEWLAGIPGFWSDHIHPQDRERVLAANARADATKAPYACEYRFLHRDGRYRWVHDEATFVTDEDVAWWQGFFLDITERKEAELQLREAEEKFRTIVEHNPAVIYTQDFDESAPSVSKTTYISPRQPEVFGYSVDEVLSDPSLWTRMIHHDDRDRVLAADLDSNRARADRFSLEYRMLAKDGRIVWVQDDAQLVSFEGRPPFWQGFLLDITERKQAEEQLERALDVEREATRRLRALDEMKNTFLQAVSHDLRTPLAAILGLAITLERGDVHLDEDDARDLAHRIAGNARRLDRLVMNLLDLDRLARGIVTPKLLPTNVGALVRRVVAESELLPGSRLRTEFDEVTIPIDAAKVERIVENLLANTARHTPADATVWVRVSTTADGVVLMVEDDGPGVAPEFRDAIFEPFLQGPGAPQHSPGVGVGLTLVRRFAELHGGRAWVDERDGGGASFRVFLPADPDVGGPPGDD